jgi:hypothetical protein
MDCAYREESLMGIGPNALELYRQLKIQGALEGITDVVELGSQDYWCPQTNLISGLFEAFGRRVDAKTYVTDAASLKPAKLIYEALGLKYACIDVDGRDGSLSWDLNFDAIPPGHVGRYGLVTNHGTTEHIVNQFNAFKAIHDLARRDGIILHILPFAGYFDHGFFNYQPNFFEALARYNSYQTLGMWVGPDKDLTAFIPWDASLLDCLSFSSKTTQALVVLHRKLHDREFCVPFQGVYEQLADDDVLSRYAMVVDGEVLDAKRVKNLTKDRLMAEEYQPQLQHLNNVIALYKGQVGELNNELARAKYQLDQLRCGRTTAAPIDAEAVRIAALEMQVEQLRGELTSFKSHFSFARPLARVVRAFRGRTS